MQDAQYSQSNSNNYNNGGIEIARRDSPSDKFENFEDFEDYNDGYQFNDELLIKHTGILISLVTKKMLII